MKPLSKYIWDDLELPISISVARYLGFGNGAMNKICQHRLGIGKLVTVEINNVLKNIIDIKN